MAIMTVLKDEQAWKEHLISEPNFWALKIPEGQ